MKKISIIAAVVLAAIMTSCGNGTPKANKGTLKSKDGEWSLIIEPGTEVIVTLE